MVRNEREEERRDLIKAVVHMNSLNTPKVIAMGVENVPKVDAVNGPKVGLENERVF